MGDPEEKASAHSYMVDGKHFVDENQDKLIDRVSQVKPILDRLYGKTILRLEMYQTIVAEKTSFDQMRCLLHSVIFPGSNEVKDEFCRILQEKESNLMRELTGLKYDPVSAQSGETPGARKPDHVMTEVQNKHKLNLKERLEWICEGHAQLGNKTSLNSFYIELYITKGGNVGVNEEHEVREIEAAFRTQNTQDTPINCNDIFKPSPGQKKPTRTVLTKGVAGIGKTVSVHKFILDWVEGKANQDVHFIFHLPFRELNFIKDEKYSLIGLIDYFHEEMNGCENVDFKKHKVLFIFDGLDESRLPLNFKSSKLSSVTEPTSVDKLLVNLIKRNLLPSALHWITSRPAAASQIPLDYIDQETEVQGFKDQQKEKYFETKITDQNLARRIILHVKSSRSLYIMCHIPVFCWISASVLEKMLGKADSGDLPTTLTHLYTCFISTLTTFFQQKYSTDSGREEKLSEADSEFILKLGELAFQQLETGYLIFNENDLKRFGIDVSAATVKSGVCTEIFKEDLTSKVCKGRVFSFIHLTVQEYLAALFVYQSFSAYSRNRVDQSPLWNLLFKPTLFDLHKKAVDQALQSQTGHLDLFLRFLLGLSLDYNQSLLPGLLPQTRSGSQSTEETVQYVKEKIRNDLSSEKSINLFHCLNELNDPSLVKEIQNDLISRRIKKEELKPARLSALAFVMLVSEENMDEFDLSKYSQSDEGLLRLLPLLKVSKIAGMEDCNLTEKCCGALASVVSSKSSHLRELNLCHNRLHDSGVKLLSVGLENLHCKLEKLLLERCKLTNKCCGVLASALSSNSSHLRELNLSDNELQDSGVWLLSTGLEDPHCKLEKLKMRYCKLTEKCCGALASALSSNSSHLRELNLSENNLQDSGVKLLSAGLENPHCKLEKLEMERCGLTEECCGALASALSSNFLHLRELNLSNNDLQDSGVKLLSAGLENPHCKLENLEMERCKLTEKCCDALASALSSNSSHLRELDLSENDLQDSGVKLLSAWLENPHCKLEKLEMERCKLTEKCCGALASALSSNSSHLRELYLSENDLQDSGMKLLSAGLENPHCKLEKLEMERCKLTEKCCDALASALSSNSSHLRELDLTSNDLQDSGVKLLSAGLESPHCKLEKLKMERCKLTDKCCGALASALSSNSSHLRELDLTYNDLHDSGVKLLSAGLENPHCKLEKLKMYSCRLTEKCCDALASALSSNSSHLRELNLSQNLLHDSGVKLLSVGLENPHCKLEKLEIRFCGLTAKCCDALASALSSNSSHLRELNLSENNLQDSGVKLLSAGLENPHCKLEKLKCLSVPI